MNEIASIIKNLGDLQATLETGATDEDIMLRLNQMRRTALSMLEGDTTTRDAAASYRKAALDKADALGVMIAMEDMRRIPDSALFRIAAAADAMAAAAKNYIQVRNSLAAEQARLAQETEENDG